MSEIGPVEVRGASIPAIGFGTWQLHGEACYEGVRHALELGYRHIDTAQMYGNEEQVGAAIADADVDRDEIFLVTKVPPDNLAPDVVRASHEQSLRRLGVDAVDLLLIHWPNDAIPLAATLDAMLGLRESGKVLHLGVSNFSPELTKEALGYAPIVTNQVEYHPFRDESALLELCIDQELALTAYTPLAKGRVSGDPTLRSIAERHGKTPAQVTLRWLVQQPNVVAIPRSSDRRHREENLAIGDLVLTEEEMAEISDLATS